jgi:hypothetical protein
MSIGQSTLDSLKKALSEVVTPGDEKYEGLIERWSEAAVKRAVGLNSKFACDAG